MSEREKQILDTFGKIVPNLSDLDKEKLLAFGEGLGFAVKPDNSDKDKPAQR